MPPCLEFLFILMIFIYTQFEALRFYPMVRIELLPSEPSATFSFPVRPSCGYQAQSEAELTFPPLREEYLAVTVRTESGFLFVVVSSVVKYLGSQFR